MIKTARAISKIASDRKTENMKVLIHLIQEVFDCKSSLHSTAMTMLCEHSNNEFNHISSREDRRWLSGYQI